MYRIIITNPHGLVIRSFIIDSNNMEEAANVIKSKNDSETKEGEPLWPVDSKIFAEPLEFVDRICEV